jgi:hypothetical protein
MPKTADFIEETKAADSLKPAKAGEKKKDGRGSHPNSRKNLKPYPKGVSGNPGGKPQYDVAAELARAVIQEYKLEAFAGLGKQLSKGNAYTFKELAERGYGKLKETKEVTHLFPEETDDDLNREIERLERKLGLAREIDDASRVGVEAARAGQANGHAKD